MALLRRKVLQVSNFTVAFGCIPHDLNNFILNISKKFKIPKVSVKEAVYLVKIIRSTHLFYSLYDTLCKKKFGIACVLIIFT